MRRLTEYERVKIALDEEQRLPCGWWFGEPCNRPRAHGDHLCAEHRIEMDARWKGIQEASHAGV